jgi:hypothetical protein
MGNWKTIADYIGTNKTTRNVEEHYWEDYMGVHGFCLPAQTIWRDQVQPTAVLCEEVKGETPSMDAAGDAQEPASEDLYRVGVTQGYSRGEPVCRDDGFQGMGSSKSTNKDKQELKDKLAQLPGSDLPGFFPLRGDFDYEYEVRGFTLSDNHMNHLTASPFDRSFSPTERR